MEGKHRKKCPLGYVAPADVRQGGGGQRSPGEDGERGVREVNKEGTNSVLGEDQNIWWWVVGG